MYRAMDTGNETAGRDEKMKTKEAVVPGCDEQEHGGGLGEGGRGNRQDEKETGTCKGEITGG